MTHWPRGSGRSLQNFVREFKSPMCLTMSFKGVDVYKFGVEQHFEEVANEFFYRTDIGDSCEREFPTNIIRVTSDPVYNTYLDTYVMRIRANTIDIEDPNGLGMRTWIVTESHGFLIIYDPSHKNLVNQCLMEPWEVVKYKYDLRNYMIHAFKKRNFQEDTSGHMHWLVRFVKNA